MRKSRPPLILFSPWLRVCTLVVLLFFTGCGVSGEDEGGTQTPRSDEPLPRAENPRELLEARLTPEGKTLLDQRIRERGWPDGLPVVSSRVTGAEARARAAARRAIGTTAGIPNDVVARYQAILSVDGRRVTQDQAVRHIRTLATRVKSLNESLAIRTAELRRLHESGDVAGLQELRRALIQEHLGIEAAPRSEGGPSHEEMKARVFAAKLNQPR